VVPSHDAPVLVGDAQPGAHVHACDAARVTARTRKKTRRTVRAGALAPGAEKDIGFFYVRYNVKEVVEAALLELTIAVLQLRAHKKVSCTESVGPKRWGTENSETQSPPAPVFPDFGDGFEV